MNRRDFMKMCGLPVGVDWEQHVIALSASNIAFSHAGMMDLPPDEIKGEGTWWLRTAGDTITIKLLGKDFYCEVCVVNFAENVDYVNATTPRKSESPLFIKFGRMFGF